MSLLQIDTIGNIQVIASTIVAEQLGVEHRATLQLIKKYLPEIESRFGQVAFEMRAGYNNAQVRVAFLTEDQAIFVSTLSANTEHVVEFKGNLVQSFQSAKRLVMDVTAHMNDDQLIALALEKAVQKRIEAESRVQLLEAQNELQELTIKAQAPVIDYAKKVLAADGGMATSIVANDFNKSAIWLNQRLKEKGVIWKVNGAWILTAKYKDKGYAIVKTHPYTDSLGNQQTNHQTYWTEEGRKFIHELLSEYLPKKAA